ncbi:MAG: hypothetical protein R3C97_01430 [Geminicoccaceae bacterium]
MRGFGGAVAIGSVNRLFHVRVVSTLAMKSLVGLTLFGQHGGVGKQFEYSFLHGPKDAPRSMRC